MGSQDIPLVTAKSNKRKRSQDLIETTPHGKKSTDNKTTTGKSWLLKQLQQKRRKVVPVTTTALKKTKKKKKKKKSKKSKKKKKRQQKEAMKRGIVDVDNTKAKYTTYCNNISWLKGETKRGKRKLAEKKHEDQSLLDNDSTEDEDVTIEDNRVLHSTTENLKKILNPPVAISPEDKWFSMITKVLEGVPENEYLAFAKALERVVGTPFVSHSVNQIMSDELTHCISALKAIQTYITG
eukprot:g3614.t1